jgi:hypothetical protein
MKPKPDSAQWWQQVAAGLSVEIASLKHLNAEQVAMYEALTRNHLELLAEVARLQQAVKRRRA